MSKLRWKVIAIVLVFLVFGAVGIYPILAARWGINSPSSDVTHFRVEGVPITQDVDFRQAATEVQDKFDRNSGANGGPVPTREVLMTNGELPRATEILPSSPAGVAGPSGTSYYLVTTPVVSFAWK
jgi:hypothetical protein